LNLPTPARATRLFLKMDTAAQVTALEAVYSFYDQFLEGFSFACRPGCHVCCTTNVTATSLETVHLMQSDCLADSSPIERVLLCVDGQPLYRPSLTTNQVAAFCLRKEDVPHDAGYHRPGTCPFVAQDGLCTVYEHRPFACRAMSSRTACTPGGEADMEPFLVTINLALYQVIEHLDREGISGNLLDVLRHLAAGQDVRPAVAGMRLLKNHGLPGFLVPPEEQGRFRAFIRRLGASRVGETDLGEILGLG
jgi:Fe-S-cluster containining protein